MKKNISFAGCGFLGIYHMGVIAALRDNAPHLLEGHISGASAGSLSAAMVLCEIPVEEIASSIVNMAVSVRKRVMGPFNPAFPVDSMLREEVLYKMFPPDAHLRVSGKIQISVTRVYDRKNILLTNFDTFDELIKALLCSSFIPGFSGWLPYTVDDIHYIDGGFSNNLPRLDENTITVSPFPGEGDICPKFEGTCDYNLTLFGASISIDTELIHRLMRVMLPPPAKDLLEVCKQGYSDACDFIFSQNISSPSCTILSYENCKIELPKSMKAVFEPIIAAEEVTENHVQIVEKHTVTLQKANFMCYKILSALQNNQGKELTKEQLENILS